MCVVVELWLYTMLRGLEYVDSCRDPSLDAEFHIGRTQPVTWETWFPLTWQGGIHHRDLVDFFSRPGRMAFMWKDIVAYVTPLSKTLPRLPFSVLGSTGNVAPRRAFLTGEVSCSQPSVQPC